MGYRIEVVDDIKSMLLFAHLQPTAVGDSLGYGKDVAALL